MGLFSKEECSYCGNRVGFFSRKKLVNNEGYVCKSCELKCSPLVNVSRFTKAELGEHMKYMERENKLYEEVFLTIDKDRRERFVCISTGVEFADEIAMFRFISPNADKKVYKELFRYDQIKSYDPYKVANTNDQGGKKYSEVGVCIQLYSTWNDPSMNKEEYKNNRSYHPYVTEIKVPTARNVDDFSHVGLKDKLDKLFGVYEDNSVVGSIKSSFVGTNKERQQMKVASEGFKALGDLAKSKITGNEADAAKAQASMDSLKNDALDYVTKNRATFSKVANDVEDSFFGNSGAEL